MWAQVSFVLSQCTRLTNGQKDLRNTVRCITCSRMAKATALITDTVCGPLCNVKITADKTDMDFSSSSFITLKSDNPDH